MSGHVSHGASIAKKRAALRSAAEEDPEFQIAPMIDILLVLLVFFMSISSTEVLQSNRELTLPVAKDAKDKEKKGAASQGQALVNILWEAVSNTGTILVDEKRLTNPKDLELTVAAKREALEQLGGGAAKGSLRVVIRADRMVRFEYMKEILKAVAAAGVSNVTFSVVDKDGGK
jgi:biopolymer transport protein ExbD